MATGGITSTSGGARAGTSRCSNDPMAALKQSLDEDGVAVLPDVLTPAECDSHVTELHEWLAKFGQNGFPDMIGSIVHKYNIAHHPVAWATRLKAAHVFESLWGTEKLTTSFDGVAIGHPPELGYESFADGKPLALHLDQGANKLGLHAYQGAVYLEDANDDDWCFAVMNASHKYHADYFAQRKSKPPRSEFLKLTQNEVEWYENRGCDIRRVAVPKGGIVVSVKEIPQKTGSHIRLWSEVNTAGTLNGQ